MEVEILADADSVARKAAALIAAEARAAIAARDRFLVAISGGRTPWLMLRALAAEEIGWDRVRVVQVDEHVAPAGHSDRNFTHLREILVDRGPLHAEHVYAMPVESSDLEGAARAYCRTLAEIAGSPPVLDLVHLGLGPDGHTASLTPGDPALGVVDADVTVTGPYQGRRRMTLTYPILNRSRRVLWLVTGSDKAEMVSRLCAGDPSIPAGRVSPVRARLLADRPAGAKLPPA